MSAYRAVVITRHGGPDAMEIREFPRAPLGTGEVRISVRAAGVNFADIMMRMGLYPEAPKPPFVPGYEVSGEIVECAPGVTGFAPGERVLAGCKFDGYATEAVVPAASVRHVPAGLSFEEAAAIPVNFLTAWIALHEMGRVRAGDRVAVQSAAGGVGTAAVQIAARAGAQVTGLAGSSAKLEAVRGLGAQAALLNADWERADDREAGAFDLILDSQGGESLKRSYRRLAPGGRVVSFGVSDMVGARRNVLKAAGFMLKNPLFPPLKLMMDNRGVFGLNLLQIFSQAASEADAAEPGAGAAQLVARSLDGILAGFARGELRAVVGRTFPLAEAGAAQAYLRSRANVGKVVLVC
jgi:NADPH:quinone reductase-like Zn-dependent oxidoreductase